MKILIDECVPWLMHKLLVGHDCATAQYRGWTGIKNGDLLALAEAEFDLFINADQSLRYQQSLSGRTIAIVQLSTNKFKRIVAAQDLLRTTISSIAPGEFRIVEIP